MDFLKLQSIETAAEQIYAQAPSLYKIETIPLSQALGRILATDILATEPLPNFRRSTVDGYAILSRDITGASESSPVFLQLAGIVSIGQGTSLTVASGCCVEVPTGGIVPAGADAVVMVEYTENFGQNGLAVSTPVAPLENIIEIGDDMQAGELVYRAGHRLRPTDIGALSAIGLTEADVWSHPTAIVISTGDELVPPGTQNLQVGKIRDISSNSLKTLAEKHGLSVIKTIVLQDDINSLQSTIKSELSECDIILVSGGSSYGKFDITAAAISNTTSPGILIHGLALKPGKPTILAYDKQSNTLVFGLPGHPVSAIVVLELLLTNIQELYTHAPPKLPIPARLAHNIPADGGKKTIIPCTLEYTGTEYLATPVFGKSAIITSLAKSDGFFIIEADVEGLPKDSRVLVHVL